MLPPVSTARMMRVHHSASADTSTPHAALYPFAKCTTHTRWHTDTGEPAPASTLSLVQRSSAASQSSSESGLLPCRKVPL
jgi:hypothetical protein